MDESGRPFDDRLVEIINDGALALMVSIGNRTRLFDTMIGLPPSTSAEIAGAANLHERYVREWLAAMVVGRIVEFDPGAQRYWIPEDRAPHLSRGAGLTSWAGYVGFMGEAEDDIVRCFREGGGLPYSRFPKYQAGLARQSAWLFDTLLVDQMLPVAPGLVERLGSGIAVADVGCGAGHAVNVMAGAFPASTFMGIDISPEAVARGQAEAAAMGLANASFVVADAAEVQVPAAFDFVLSYVSLHEQAHPARSVQGIFRSLKPGGAFLCVEPDLSSDVNDNMDNQMAPFLYTVSTFICMSVSLAQGGEGVGEAFGGPHAQRLWREAGFELEAEIRPEFDEGKTYYVLRKPA